MRPEVWRLRIMLTNGPPVSLVPFRIAHSRFEDALCITALYIHRYGQPDDPSGGLDPVSVAPISACVLNIVEKDEGIDAPDQVEIALPRYVVRLADRHAHARIPSSAGCRQPRCD